MSVIEKINSDLKTAMKSGDKVAVDVLRLLKSEIGYSRIEKGDELDDKELTTLLASLLKKWSGAIVQFKNGGREDLVRQETAKLNILKRYLPEQLTDKELSDIIKKTIGEIGATSKADFGKVMKSVMGQVRGRADGKKIKEMVSSLLSDK